MPDQGLYSWKNKSPTSNIEVAIDDPIQIRDTYITSFSSPNKVLVFEPIADGFVEQNNQLPPSSLQDTGGGGLTVAEDARNEVPIGIYDKAKCVELFNEYLRLHEWLWNHFDPFVGQKLMELAGYWKPNGLSPDHPVYQFLACAVNSHFKQAGDSDKQRGFFESPGEYLKRIFGGPDLPSVEGVPPFKIPVLPPIPTDPINVGPFLGDPRLLEEFRKAIRDLIKRLREIQKEYIENAGGQVPPGLPSGAEPPPDPGEFDDDDYRGFPPECKDKLKDAMKRLMDDFTYILPIIENLDDTIKLYREIHANCLDKLPFDEFRNRQIGRFNDLNDFYKYLMEWIERNVMDIWGQVPNLKPNFVPLSNASVNYPNDGGLFTRWMDHAVYNGRPDRFTVGADKYKSWSNQSEETRSFFPPIKDFSAIFDGDEWDDIDVWIYFLSQLAYAFRPGYGNTIPLSDYQDFVDHLQIYAAIPVKSMIPDVLREELNDWSGEKLT